MIKSRGKIPKEDHIEIYKRYCAGETLKSIADEYGVVPSSISRIRLDVLKKLKTAEYHNGRPRY